jgi:LysM domain
VSAEKDPPTPAPPPTATGICKRYKVQAGDNVYTISQKYNVVYEDLLAALVDCIDYDVKTVLQTGQDVCVSPYYDNCKYVTQTGLSSQINTNCSTPDYRVLKSVYYVFLLVQMPKKTARFTMFRRAIPWPALPPHLRCRLMLSCP